MKIKTKMLLEAMKCCLPGIDDKNSILEGADTFVLSNNQIHSYNDHISVSVPVADLEELTGAVKAADFYKMISKLKAGEFELIVEEKSWNISCGKIKIEMNLLADTVLSKINNIEIKEWKSLPDNFFEALDCCKMGCNPTPLAGIFVSGKNMFSTDNKRINYYSMNTEMESFWISDSSAGELMKLKDVNEYSLGNYWINFKSASGNRFSIRKLSSEKYPLKTLTDIVQNHQQEEKDISLQLPPSIFEALDRAFVLSGKLEEFYLIKLLLDKHNTKIISEKVSGKYEEILELPKKKDVPDFEPLEMSVDYLHMKNALKRSLNFYIKSMKTGEEEVYRIVFHSPNYMGIMTAISRG